MKRLEEFTKIIYTCFTVLSVSYGFNDESYYSKRVQRQALINNRDLCVLPSHPSFGTWKVFRSSNDYVPGMTVPQDTILKVDCNLGYKLEGNNFLLCSEGRWTSEIGKCSKVCPPLRNTASRTVTCDHKNLGIGDCMNATEGTTASFQCANFYEEATLIKNRLLVCRNGAWNRPIPDCIPVCGRRSVSGVPLIVNGTYAKRGEFPWQAALYKKSEEYELLCSGTLISINVVLTAAHCVTDNKGNIKPKNMFVVALGKYYSKFDDPRDLSAQILELHDIFIEPQYRANVQNYFADIAILVTKKSFTLTAQIQPVCVDWDLAHTNSTQDGYGYISGWGYTVNGKPAETLQQLRIPIINHKVCEKALPEAFASYFTIDKLCAGYLNQSTSICNGDGGGGLVSRQYERFYIIGIASLSVASPAGGCDSQQYSLYTKVAYYAPTFLRRIMSEVDTLNQRNESKECILPDYSNNGEWIVVGSSTSQKPREWVSSNTTLHIICDKFYKLDGPSHTKCENGKWNVTLGICLASCPPIKERFLQAICSDGTNCVNVSDGTVAKLECSPFYENLALNTNPFTKCVNGKWSPQIPECSPICGVKPDSELLENKPYFPWNIAIYKNESRSNIFKCSGTLVSERIVLTSAQCVSDENGNLLPCAEYTVVAGKSTEAYEDPKDDKAQYLHLEKIVIFEEYRGNKWKYWADIALLVAQKPFTLNERVQLACLDWNNKYLKELEQARIKRYIAGPLALKSSSQEVFEISVSLANFTQCYQQLSLSTREGDSGDYTLYYSSDKLCSDYININQTSLLRVNRGTGLVSRNKYDNRYYLTGIASIFPETYQNQTWILFTKLSKYIPNFILDNIKVYAPPSIPYFQPTCGVKSLKIETLIIGGSTAKRGDYPWQIAIYKRNETKNDFACGGSLINPRVILTAAHCITDAYGKKLPMELYTVVAGKYYSTFKHQEDQNAQFSKLLDMSVPSKYEGYLQNYLADIAVLITENSFVLSTHVVPVCIDWENKYESYFLKPSIKGTVAGWGFTEEEGKAALELQWLEVPYIEKDQCKKHLSDYNIFVTSDKLCLGYLNKSKSLCKGDSGDGLVYKNELDDRYYLMAVVSLSPKSPTADSCDSQKYTLYTRVSDYTKNFILNKVQLYWR